MKYKFLFPFSLESFYFNFFSSDSVWSELLDILRKITDAEFVCNFCVQTQLYRVPWVKELLALGKLRISECRSTSAAESLLLTLKMFFTFELVFPSGTINEWNSFISKDNTMFIQSMKFLQVVRLPLYIFIQCIVDDNSLYNAYHFILSG